ncbi:hypothetical protein TWF696_008712 [Orbilia brochopaga]|uniref:Uncharacterized protein n=1 Tax=Orbilia brochopaga TaxID=3140254 RepID=A0AAV9UM83_9PEZI
MPSFSRNQISLNIANTNGAEYYDQICAISQETINKNFEVLFAQRKELVELWYKDIRGDNATMDAILDPPQVKLQIGSSDVPELYFEIHIKTGQIKLAADKIQKIDNWIITVRSQLFDSQVSPNPNHTEEEAEAAAAQLDEIKKSYDIGKIEAAIKNAQTKSAVAPGSKKNPTPLEPGDYSIQRLYCVIAEGNWTVPDESRSYLPDPDFPNDKSKRISIADWRASNRDSQTRLMANSVSRVLGNWAEDNQESAFWNLGIQVRLPREKVAEERALATCAPSAVRLQNYAYITEANQAKLEREKREGKTPTPISSLVEYGHPQNCLVFCETVLRDLPKAGARLEYGGNLAEPPQQGIPAIPGTFVLDHRLYFEKKILKPLRELCVATSVIPCYPKMFTDYKTGEQQFQSQYVVGGNPKNSSDYPGLPDQNPSNPAFDFVFEENGKYAWRRKWPAPGSSTEIKTYTDCNSAPVYRKWVIEADNSVEVSWNPGEDKIKVRGAVTYDHWEAYNSSNMKFGWGSYSGCMWGDFKIFVNWSFNIDLTDKKMSFEEKKKALKEAARLRKEEEKQKAEGKIPKDQPSKVPEVPNGIINPVITGLKPNFEPENLSVYRTGGRYVRDKTDEKMRDQVALSLQSGLKKVLTEIAATLHDAGSFIYPGTRTLVFEDPKLGSSGNILSTIDYLDLDDGLVIVNAPVPKPIDETGSKKVPPVTHDSTVTGNPAHITWDPKITYVSHTQTATLVLGGRNNAPDPMAFEEIAVQLLPTGGKNCLFKASAYNWTSKSEADDKERQERQRKEAEKREKGISGGENTGTVDHTASANGDGVSSSSSANGNGVGASSSTNGHGADASSSTVGTNGATGDGEKAPTSTWDFMQRAVNEQLQVTPDQETNSPIFRIRPVPPPKRTKKTPRFTMQRGGYFSLTLEGAVSGPGEYILQLDETWNYPDYTKDMKGKRAATTFLKVILTEGTDGIVYVTSQEDADKTRGVAPKPST